VSAEPSQPSPPAPRIAIVYDCLFPHTVGGAERWYRSLAERLGRGHQVAYLTRRQWGDEGPGTAFETVAVSRGGELYTRSGRRRVWPPIRFGAGVFWHLLRRGGRYDALHTASFPYFSLLGAWLALRLRRSPASLVVDWHEVWGRDYWISYLGPVGGRIGHLVQRLCARLPDRSFTFSRMHAERLEAEGHRAPLTRLTGEYAGTQGGAGSDAGAGAAHAAGAPAASAAPETTSPPCVVFAGRHIPEKRVTAIPGAIAAARRELPELRGLILGDGPDFERTGARIAELGLDGAVELPGRAPAAEVARALATASCLLLPSEREGYGLVVVESVSVGTPAVVVAGPENAATELIEPGVNGLIAPSADPDALAAAIVEVVRAGEGMRRSTREWYERHAAELSIESSLEAVEAAYGPGATGDPPRS
jgi:glycosyltransferase involved in cell wall biosynthesis